MKTPLRNRIGRFEISLDLLDSNPEAVQAVMGRCIILRCECMFFRNVLEYVAISNYFDEAEEGTINPTYSVTVAEGDIKFKRLASPNEGEQSK